MRRKHGQCGMTLMEIMVTMAVILILAGTLLGITRYIKIRASEHLTESMLEVLVLALEQYYDDFGAFPFATPDTNTNSILGDDYTVADLVNDIANDIAPGASGSVSSGSLLQKDASSGALYYFLDKNPNSRKVIEAVSATLVTNKGSFGNPVKITINTTPSETVDLVRFIDTWGTSIRYVYIDGTAFPSLRSAGADEIFDTNDDIVCK